MKIKLLMDDINQVLDNYISTAAIEAGYAKFDENGMLEGVFTGYTMEADPFNKGKERVSYGLKIDDSDVKLGSSSIRLAKAFKKAGVKAGDQIRIIRIGEGFETMYSVTVLGRKAIEEELSAEDMAKEKELDELLAS